MMPESAPPPIMGDTPPDQPHPRSLQDVLIELDNILWGDGQFTPDEKSLFGEFVEIQQQKIQAFVAGQQVGPGLELSQMMGAPGGEPGMEATEQADPGATEDLYGSAGEPIDDEESPV